ncbi:MAG: glucose-1-phosphate cytidylyltransferase [Candidatus Binatia bacterium]
MKVVILCGGQGTRLREETEVRPKPMVEIGGRPILWHIMKLYAHHGFRDFLLCLGYKGYVVKDFFLHYEARTKDFTVHIGAQRKVEFHDSQPEEGWTVTLAETGEATLTGARLHRIGAYLGRGPFCVTYGDGVADVDIRGLVEFHKAHGKLGTITGVRPVGRFGELEVDAERVTHFAEKPQATGGLINGGFFVFEREFIDRYLDGREDLSLEQEPLQRLAGDGELMVWRHDGFWQPMDTYREWRVLEELWREGRAPWKIWN